MPSSIDGNNTISNVDVWTANDVGVIAYLSATQLSALAAAGGLTPNATYVESDTSSILDAYSSTTAIRRYLPLATYDPLTNYNNLMNTITSAGNGAVLVAPPRQTYLLGRQITPLTGQKLLGNGSVLKLQNQVYTTLTGAATVASAGSNVSVAFSVASSTGFFVGQRVAVDDVTVGGQRTCTNKIGIVTSVDVGSVTVQFVNNNADVMSVTTDLTTWLETQNTTFGFHVGAYLCSASSLLTVNQSASNIVVADWEIDGNRANNAFGSRWETTPGMDFRALSARIMDMWIHDTMADGLVHGANGLAATNLRIDKPGGMGIHISDAAGGIYGGKRTILRDLWIDSAGMGSPTQGHYGGCTSSHPAYPCIGFSRNNDHILIQGAHLTDNYGVQGTTWGQAIGCVTGGDNYAIEFSDVYVSGFNKGIGAIQIVRSSGGASVPTDPPGNAALAPIRINFDQLHVDDCAPLSVGTFNQWECSLIGCYTGTTPHTQRVNITNSDFTDSPLVIQDANVSFGGRVEFVATDIAKSSSLIIIGSSTSACSVDITGVTARRPVTTSGNVGSAPAQNIYASNIYIQGGSVVGSDVKLLDGQTGVRVQTGASFRINNLRCQNNYYYGVVGISSNTEIALQSPVIRLASGYTASSPWAGVDAASGGGVLGTGSTLTIINPDIDAVTTSATQYGVRLSTTSSATIPRQQIVGGRIRVSGTSTTPIQSGGASSLAVVVGTLLSHAFTPGAAETSSGTVVNTGA